MAKRVSLNDMSGRRRRLRRVFFWSAFVGGIVIVIGVLAWTIVFSPLFLIRDLRVNGATSLPPEHIHVFLESRVAHGRVSGIMGPKNMFVWPSRFSEEDLRELPVLTSINIEKDYFRRTITATVTERQRVGIWCFAKTEPEVCFWFDPAGVLFMPAYFAEGNLIPVVRDYSRDSLSTGESILSSRFLPNLFSVFDALQAAPVSVRELRLNDLVLQEVVAETYDGPRLLFSLRFPTAGVENAISEVERITPIANLQYIDFRVQNKVYYK